MTVNHSNIIGRKQELSVLESALLSSEAEMVAVVGRRRVGKTYLIAQAYQERIVFELTGVQRATLKQQLTNFRDQLSGYSDSELSLEVPQDWLSAFRMLRQYLQKKIGTEKQVIFFDELPWMSNPKSGFLEAFGYFWNSWASRQPLVVVICGSAASWMIQKVVRDTGGLHNRITRRIHLEPFNLWETEQFLKNKGVGWDRYQILQFYMVTGGIPHYLKEAKPGKSAMQIIDQICFEPNGLLRDEFDKLYAALFKNAQSHIQVVRALFSKKSGMNRSEILENLQAGSGGGLTMVLEELEQSGFITAYYPYGKKIRDKVWRLTDEYSSFYLQFIEDKMIQREFNWLNLMDSQTYKIWSGFAFENICLRHLPQIKKALGITGVYTTAAAFYKKTTDDMPGAQIDLILERKDRVINLFEIKFYSEPIQINEAFLTALRLKQAAFKASCKTNHYIFWVLICTFGIKNPGMLDAVITMDDLFEP